MKRRATEDRNGNAPLTAAFASLERGAKLHSGRAASDLRACMSSLENGAHREIGEDWRALSKLLSDLVREIRAAVRAATRAGATVEARQRAMFALIEVSRKLLFSIRQMTARDQSLAF